MHAEQYRYVLDDQDVVVSSVLLGDSHDSWNDAAGCRPVEGASVWDFVAGDEIQLLYKALFEKVRGGSVLGPIPIRCDSPSERVFVELFLSPAGGGRIEVRSCFVKVENREFVPLLDPSVSRSNEILTICSMCKKIEGPGGEWIAIEEAVDSLHLLEKEELPLLSHGLCSDCYHSAMELAGFPKQVD